MSKDYFDSSFPFSPLCITVPPPLNEEIPTRKTVLLSNASIHLGIDEEEMDIFFDDSENPITLLFDKRGE
tara:strand:- start:2978 stop:3187 length:210 start_codon:yes stop_codon:yes gene_type:complete